MRKAVVAGLVGVGLLAGCGEAGEAYVQRIEDNRQEYGRIVSEGDVMSTTTQGETSIMIVKHPRGTYECTLWRAHRTCKLL